MTASKTYATVEDIRREAGFENATNLKDSAIPYVSGLNGTNASQQTHPSA